VIKGSTTWSNASTNRIWGNFGLVGGECSYWACVDYDIGSVAGAGLFAGGYTGKARMVVDEDKKVMVD
jgi:hypothetical protein